MKGIRKESTCRLTQHITFEKSDIQPASTTTISDDVFTNGETTNNYEEYSELKHRNQAKKIKINVSGKLFEINAEILARIPFTKLSQLSANDENYDRIKHEFFFDRNSTIFEYILDFYRTGELHLPVSFCGGQIQKELEYWEIDESDISSCCWLTYCKFREHKDKLIDFDRIIRIKKFIDDSNSTELNLIQRIRNKLWVIFEYPNESRLGKVISGLTILFVFASLFNIIFDSYQPWFIEECTNCNNTMANTSLMQFQKRPHLYFKYSNYVYTAYFTLELLLQLFCAKNYIKFIKSYYTIIDVITLIIYYLQITFSELDKDIQPISKESGPKKFMFFLQLFRICRLIKIFKNYSALKIITLTFRTTIRELILVLTIFGLLIIIFSCMLHFIESTPNSDHFDNIPITIWFTLITMTTIGYGDIVPKTALGRVVTSIIAIFGMLILAFIVPISVNSFVVYYNHIQARIKYSSLKYSLKRIRYGSKKQKRMMDKNKDLDAT